MVETASLLHNQRKHLTLLSLEDASSVGSRALGNVPTLKARVTKGDLFKSIGVTVNFLTNLSS